MNFGQRITLLWINLFIAVHYGIHSQASIYTTEPPRVQEQDCTVKVLFNTTHALYAHDRSELPTVFLTVEVTSYETSCVFDLDEYLVKYLINLNNTLSFGGVGLVCRERLLVALKTNYSERYSNVFGQFEVIECNMLSSDINLVSSLMDLRVLNALNGTIFVKNDNSKSTECWSKNIASVAFYQHDIQPNIEDFFDCTQLFLDLSEIKLVNMSLMEVPLFLESRAPNLQSLELDTNTILKPPHFPWTNFSTLLPRGTSRSSYEQSHYVDSIGLKVDLNKWRKTFSMNNNNITDLTDYQFTGAIQYISLKNNGLQAIGTDTFRKATGLQILILANNKLQKLPDFAFSTLTELHELSIGYNDMYELSNNLFSGLGYLEKLNLRNNRIKRIPFTAIRNLYSLKDLNFAYNQITTLSRDMFPLYSKLDAVDFSGNPLVALPVFFLNIRSLQTIKLQHTKITLSKLPRTLKTLDPLVLWQHNSYPDNNIFNSPDKKRKMDLSNSEIRSIPIPKVMTRIEIRTLTALFKNFDILIDGNPIVCDCNILPIQKYLRACKKDGNFTGNELYFSEWKCAFPLELESISIMSVNDTYCAENITKCPEKCICYRRSLSRIIVIDCRNTGIDEIPHTVPTGILELWLQNNSITLFTGRNYFKYCKLINLENNAIHKIDNNVTSTMRSGVVVNLSNNFIRYIPKNFKDANFGILYIHDNSFLCDCRSLWMKEWLLRNGRVVMDSDIVSCVTLDDSSGTVKTIPDEMFICAEDPNKIKILLPPILGALFFLGAVLLSIIFIHRYQHDICFLIFVHFNIRIIRSETSKSTEQYDVVLIYAKSLSEWVIRILIPHTTSIRQNISVFNLYDSCIPGLSYKENIDMAVANSKRMLFIQSIESDSDENCQYALQEARDKCKNGRPDYFILAIHEKQTTTRSENAFINIFIKSKRAILTSETQFKEKIHFNLPAFEKPTSLESVELTLETHYAEKLHKGSVGGFYEKFLYFSNSYDDWAIIKPLVGKLEEKYSLCIPDREFLPGVPKNENILNGINTSKFTVICLSRSHCEDEWTTFTFQVAHQKCLSKGDNSLLLILLDEFDESSVDESIQHYIQTHACLSFNDPEIVAKLGKAFAFSPKDSKDKEMELDDKHDVEFGT